MKNELDSGRNNKLFSYLDYIDSDELYLLKRYINSDYFNTNKRLRNLFEAILITKKEYSSFKLINSVKLYHATFPDRSTKTINDDFSALFKLVKGFLAQEKYNLDLDAKTRYLIDNLIEKKAINQVTLLLNREAKNYENPTKSIKKESFDTYYHDWLISQKRLNYFIVNKKDKIKLQHMKDVDENMDKYYTVVKSAYWSTTENIARIYGIDFKVGFKELLTKLKNNISVEDCPLVHRYFESTPSLDNFSDQQFQKCKSIFDTHINRLSDYEQIQFCTLLHNISAVKGFKSPDPKWIDYRILFLDYQSRQELKLGKGHKITRAFSLFIYFRLLLEAQKLELFDKELKKYKPKIIFQSEEEKYGYFTFLKILKLCVQSELETQQNKANFYYDQAKKQLDRYEEAIARGERQYPNARTRMAYSLLGLKIYYFQNNSFLNRRGKVHKYIINFKKMDETFKQPYINFVQIVLQLYKLRKRKSPSQNQLTEMKELIDTSSLIDRKWLYNRLNDIQSSTSLN